MHGHTSPVCVLCSVSVLLVMWSSCDSHVTCLYYINFSGTVEVPITLPPSEYIGKVQDQLMVNISAFVTVKETDSVFVDKETFRFKTPDIALSVKDQIDVGNSEPVTVSFTNPLDVVLSNVKWFVEGAGLTKPIKLVGRYVRHVYTSGSH